MIQQTNITTRNNWYGWFDSGQSDASQKYFCAICNLSILTLKIRDGWFYLTGDLGAPFWTSEAFTMQILTPEKRDEWFCFMDDPMACIFRQVAHWNSKWSSFDVINTDGRDAHLEADAFVKSVKSAILLSYGVILLCYKRSNDLINMFSLIFFLLSMYSKVTPLEC